MNGKRWGLETAALIAGLAIPLGGSWALAQEPPGLSSGTGQGTGSGLSSGVQRSRSGSISGTGPPRAIERSNQGPREGAPVRGMGLGPGVNVQYPNDPYLIPFMTMAQEGGAIDPSLPTGVTPELVKNAKLIGTVEERSLALQRIANSAISSNQLFQAHQILEDAVHSAVEVQTPLVRDQRLIAIVTSLTLLNDALLREGQKGTLVPPPVDVKPEAIPKRADPQVLIRMARLEWSRAAYLAGLIGNPTYRSEMLYRVSDNQASGSASIANEFIEDDLDAAKPNQGRIERNKVYQAAADAELVDSYNVAEKIERPIWRFRAMVRIALQAADSRQYDRGFELARRIQNAESRTESLLLIAEALCRHDHNDRATPVYEEAARAAASIQQEGLRGVITGFLVDSLIAAGRFDDARACIVIYPEESQRLVALGAIAESQGRRGGAESARRWIAADVPAAYRPTLYRRVVAGYLWAIEQNRGQKFPK